MRFKLNLQQFGGQGFLGLRDLSIVKNGQRWNVDVRGTNANWNLETDEASRLIDNILREGRPLTETELAALNTGLDTATLRNAQALIINNNKDKFGFSINSDGTISQNEGLQVPGGDQASAFNEYYRDLYSLEPGTGGAEMLQRLEQSYQNQAQQQAMLADVGFQQAALQQAQTVKQITDQVRSERMARLRAGMSESQIANQDMQMLLTNVNTLNQNAQMLNQARLEAQAGINTAQDQAYQDFLAQSAQRGQVASAMAASDAGDVYQQTIRQMSTLYGNDPSKWTSTQWQQVTQQVTGANNK